MQEYTVKIDNKGTERWHNKDGKFHREDDKPAVIFANGNQFWYVNGKRHRVGGPAVISHNGSQFWYLNGKRHRVDGPAIVCANGYTSYWLNGEYQYDAKRTVSSSGK
jgi:hypothetical protein